MTDERRRQISEELDREIEAMMAGWKVIHKLAKATSKTNKLTERKMEKIVAYLKAVSEVYDGSDLVVRDGNNIRFDGTLVDIFYYYTDEDTREEFADLVSNLGLFWEMVTGSEIVICEGF